MKLAKFPLLVGIAALAPAVWMTLNRAEDFDVDFRSYYELQSSFGATIQNLHFDGEGELTVKIKSASGSPQTSTIELESGIAHHKDALVSLSTVYGGGDTTLLNNVSLPFRGNFNFSMDDFVLEVTDQDSVKTEAIQRVIDDAGVSKGAPALEVIEKLSAYLHKELFPHRGLPSAAMRRLDGLEQYIEATSGRAEVYCANQAEIFAYFANAAGVPTRLVDVGGVFEGFSIAEHAFAESFVAELGGWVYVDLQLNIAYVTDLRGKPLNGIDILIRHATNSDSDLYAYVIENGTVVKRSYSTVEEMSRIFIPPEATLMYLWGTQDRYSLLNRVMRLMLRPQPGFSLRVSGAGTYWRLFFSYLAVLGLGVWSMSTVLTLRRKSATSDKAHSTT